MAIRERKSMEHALKLVTARHKKLDAKQKRKCKFKPFKQGSKVMLLTSGLNTKKKTVDITNSLYIIHRVIGKNTYRLKDELGKKLKYLVNGRRLSHILPIDRKPVEKSTESTAVE